MKIISFSLFLLLLTFSINAQNSTTILDSVFEQHLINLGYDNSLDSLVVTSNISNLDTLVIIGFSGFRITNLSGIEDFSNLQYLDCSDNNIETLDLNSNNNLKYLDCSSNSLESLRIDSLNALYTLKCSFNNLNELNTDGNGSLTALECISNNIGSLDLVNNIFLAEVRCGHNDLSELDLSSLDLYLLQCEHNPITEINLTNNTSLQHLTCHDNLLQTINLNDNSDLEWLSILNNNLSILDLSTNYNITNLYCNNNLNLYCIQVYDTSLINNWFYNIDSQQYFSENCNYTLVDETHDNSGKIISIKDIYGRECSVTENILLFYIYENGTIKKRITLY
jgi:Leucine-rich repeat (LRR) protein